jgi:hypothetical protein
VGRTETADPHVVVQTHPGDAGPHHFVVEAVDPGGLSDARYPTLDFVLDPAP